MNSWEIYNKDGAIKVVSPSNSTAVRKSDGKLQYSGTWMGDCFVTLSFTSEVPIEWAVGDYVMYRGEKFVLNYDPSLVKKARKNSHGAAFEYKDVKFNALQYELGETMFCDYVLGDNYIHYSSLPDFSFFAKDIDDLADRLQANMNRYCSDNSFSVQDYWVFLTPSRARTMSRVSVIEQEGSALANLVSGAWNTYYDPQNLLEGKTEKSVAIQNKTVAESLELIHDTFGLNYIIRGRFVMIGTESLDAGMLFQYGKGNGLAEIERTADKDQAIVTKLFAYGNSTNLPPRYYVGKGKNYYLQKSQGFRCVYRTDRAELLPENNVPSGAILSEDEFFVFNDVRYSDSLFTSPSQEKSGAGGKAVGHGVTVLIGNNVYPAFCTSLTNYYPLQSGVRTSQVANKLNNLALYFDGEIYVDALISAEIGNGTRISIVDGLNVSNWPYVEDVEEFILPNNLAISRLMLPGFPNKGLKQWVLDNDGVENADGSVTWNEHTAFFSENPFSPYILSPNYKKYGIKEYSKNWDGSDDTIDIYPTIENSGADALLDAPVIADNGVYGDTEPQKITVKIPSLGAYMLSIHIGEESSISMKSGYCEGREFDIKKATEVSGGWNLEIERYHDEGLDLYFPYSYGVSTGGTAASDEPYQLQAGDKFVLLGIDMPDVYVENGAEKLLEEALTWLEQNDAPRFVYVPKIDEILMARQHDAAVASIGTQHELVSIHDTLKEGGRITFSDTDLDVAENMFIDTLQINENDNGCIPTYSVTLRERKSKGTLATVKQQLENVQQAVAGGVGSAQIKEIVDKYGRTLFLSKTSDDYTPYTLGMKNAVVEENIEVGGKVRTDEIEAQNGDTVNLDGNLNVEDNLTVEENINARKEIVVGQDVSGHNEVIRTPDFVSDLQGFKIDRLGNAEFESLNVRSVLKVNELLVNRQQAQEGDTIYTDNDKIEEVESVTIEGESSYLLTLEAKWDGYFTAQQWGNILRGLINTLAAKQAHVSDEESTSVETDGQNKYYTSWMRVVGTYYTEPSICTTPNTIRVVLYGDDQTPAGKNFAPCKLMVIARWGCINYASGDSSKIPGETYEAKLASIRRRQQLFYLSASEGRLVKLTNVNLPILRNDNIGTTLGTLPEFVKNYGNVRSKYIEGRDYLYAQGIVVQDLIPIDFEGHPIITVVECNDWVDGTGVITSEDLENPKSSYIGAGIYLAGEYNARTQRYETHKVRHSNGIWLCLQHQPVISGGTVTYYEPKFGSSYWRLVDGDGSYRIEFTSSKGWSFRRNAVDTIVEGHLYWGNVDITADVAAEFWNWTRQMEDGTTDPTWNAQHAQMKSFHLTNSDMPQNWSSSNKAIFTLTITITDGQTTQYVDNQIIS